MALRLANNFIGTRVGDSSAVDIRPFFKHLTGTNLDRVNYSFIEFHKNDYSREPIGYIVYCDYTGKSITMHVHLPNMLTKSVICSMFKYPFKELNVDRLFIEFPLVNEKIRSMADRVGFCYTASVENYYGYRNDKIIMCAEYHDIQRWLK